MKDLTGLKFGDLTIIAQSSQKTQSGAWYWIARCSCGSQKLVLAGNLKRNRMKCKCPKEGVNLVNIYNGKEMRFASLKEAGKYLGYSSVTIHNMRNKDMLIDGRWKIYQGSQLRLFDGKHNRYFFKSYAELANYTGKDVEEVKWGLLKTGTIAGLATTKEKASQPQLNVRKIIGNTTVYLPYSQWYLHQKWI
jgi:hypothetical protein